MSHRCADQERLILSHEPQVVNAAQHHAGTGYRTDETHADMRLRHMLIDKRAYPKAASTAWRV